MSDFLTQIPDGIRLEVRAAGRPLTSNESAAQFGSLGGGNAVRLTDPVDLNLVAFNLSNVEIPLPDGALAQTYQVSLPIIAQPTNPDQTFAWLVEVQHDGQFLGYMRYPSTFDPQTNSLVYALPAQILQKSAVLPVILTASKVQAFLPEVHSWSSPFNGADDLGTTGVLWSTYDVVAPQVGGRIGISNPDTGEMIWIDASGVGPAGVAPPPEPTA